MSGSERKRRILYGFRKAAGVGFGVLGVWTLFCFVRTPDSILGMRCVFNVVACIVFLSTVEATSAESGALTVGVCLLHAAVPLLLGRGPLPPLVPLAGPALIVIGLSIAALALIDLGRSFGILPANRGVVAIGMYRFVRHPAYFGYLIGVVGWLIWEPGVMNALVLMAFVLLTGFRIILEERVLRRDPTYLAYQVRVRHRLLPGIY